MSDNYIQEKSGKICDKDLPLSFTEDRHLEPIEGLDHVDGMAQMWRMKERVSISSKECFNIILNIFFVDENC